MRLCLHRFSAGQCMPTLDSCPGRTGVDKRSVDTWMCPEQVRVLPHARSTANPARSGLQLNTAVPDHLLTLRQQHPLPVVPCMQPGSG